MTRPARAHRILRRIAAAIIAAITAVALAGCQLGEPDDDITIGLTYTPNIQFAPFYVAEELGYFEDAGVNVELRHHGESEELFGALKNGTEDMVYASGDEITQAAAGGLDAKAVATLYATYPAVLIAPADSDITSAADLRGKRVGVPGAYGQTYFALLAMLADAGMSIDDITLEQIGYTQQAALTSGKVDAVMGFVNNDAVQLDASGFAVRTIEAVDADEPRLVGPALTASNQLISQHGEQIDGILTAIDRANEVIRTDPERAVEIAANYIPTLTTDEQREAALATLKATTPLLSDTMRNVQADWQRMASFLADEGLITERVAPDSLFTNEFLGPDASGA